MLGQEKMLKRKTITSPSLISLCETRLENTESGYSQILARNNEVAFHYMCFFLAKAIKIVLFLMRDVLGEKV